MTRVQQRLVALDVTAWLVGIGAGLIVLGPGIGTGQLLSLDLVMVGPMPMPSGVWGLGPQLPQRMPLGVVLAALSRVLSGPGAAKLVIVLSVAAATAGAARLVGRAPRVVQVGAGLLYGCGPFVLTRAGVGHLHVLVAAAVLPWALPHLLRPMDDLRQTFLWSAALAFGGSTGGLLALVLVGTGLFADRCRRPWRCLGALAFAQIPWLVPAAVALLSGATVDNSSVFRTDVSGPGGILRLAAGAGFWRSSNQVGGGTDQAIVGALILLLALSGNRDLPPSWKRRGAVVAAVGAGLATASALPVVRSVYDWFTSMPIGSALRDSDRASLLMLVWLAPSAALGTVRLSRALRQLGGGASRAALSLPLALAVVAAGPGLFGVNGSFDPVQLPSGWNRVRTIVHQQPGPVLALPWHEYLDLPVADGRRVLNPLPDFLDGDVLSSFDPETGTPHQEQLDHRADHINELVLALERNTPISAQLRALGIRWVVLLHAVDWSAYHHLSDDPGLVPAYADGDIDLFAVTGWIGTFVNGNTGASVAASSPISPLVHLDDSGPVTWNHPSQFGWIRGTERGVVTTTGQLQFRGRSSVIWFWPAVLAALLQILWVISAILTGSRLVRHRRSLSVAADAGTVRTAPMRRQSE